MQKKPMFHSISLSLLVLSVFISRAQPACEYGDIRLTGGSTRFEGRIEVCLNNEWGTVCDDDHSTGSAVLSQAQVDIIHTLVCKQLGFEANTERFLTTGRSNPTTESLFSQLTDPNSVPTHLDDVMCTGEERGLVDCAHSGIGVENCQHFEDIGIKCSPVDCVDGTIQLSDSDPYNSGRVELCYKGSWNTVSDLTPEAANVICGQLEFSNTDAQINLFGVGFGNILRLDCDGSETNISSCTISRIGSYNHTRDSGVVCANRTEPCDVSSTPEECSLTTTEGTTTATTGSQEDTTSLQDTLSGPVCSDDNILGILLGVSLTLLLGVIVGWISTCIVLTRKLRQKSSVSDNNRAAADGLAERVYSTSPTQGYTSVDIPPPVDEQSDEYILNESYGKPFTETSNPAYLGFQPAGQNNIHTIVDSSPKKMPEPQNQIDGQSEKSLAQPGHQSNVDDNYYSYVDSEMRSNEGDEFCPQEPLYELIENTSEL